VQQRAYHFAYFRITSEADFNALFIPGGHSGSFMMSNAANAYITAHRGFPSFLFAGEEDPVQDQRILIPRFVTDKTTSIVAPSALRLQALPLWIGPLTCGTRGPAHSSV
jgi:D-aminopeptidase